MVVMMGLLFSGATVGVGVGSGVLGVDLASL